MYALGALGLVKRQQAIDTLQDLREWMKNPIDSPGIFSVPKNSEIKDLFERAQQVAYLQL